MSKNKKRISILILLLLVTCTLCLSVSFSTGKVMAEETGSFEMAYGANLKLGKDGLRFKVRFDKSTYDKIVTNDKENKVELHAYITYAEDFADYTNNYVNMQNKIGGKLDETKIYKDGEYYYANVCIVNLYKASAALVGRNLACIAFIVDNTAETPVYKYAEFPNGADETGERSIDNITRSQYGVITSAIFDADFKNVDTIFENHGWFGEKANPIVVENGKDYDTLIDKVNTSNAFKGKTVIVRDGVTATKEITNEENKPAIKKEIVITFDKANGEAEETIKILEGEKISELPNDPTKAEEVDKTYRFDGWFNGETRITTDTVFTESVTLTAKYTAVDKLFTITWKNADGTILETDENVKYGETPTYDGESPADCASDTTKYINFIGWTPEVVGVTGDATYTAVFEKTEVFAKNFVKNGNVYSNTSVEYEAFTKKAPGYYYFSNEASTIAVLSARITVPYVDDNAMIGFTMSADDNLGLQTNCIQFYIGKNKVFSAVGNCEDGYNKGREYFTSTNIFTAEKLYADLSLVFYNDTIYLYVDGEMCTGNFSNCYTMPVSVTSGHLKESGSYAVGTAFRFGLAESSCWRTVVTYSEVSLKTGEDGLNEIKTNKLYKGLIDNSVSKNFIKNGNNYNNKAVAYEAYVKKAPGYYYFSGEATTVAVLSARITVPYVDDNAMIGFTMSADEDLTAQENCIQFYINKNKILSAVGNCEEDGYNKGREYFTSTNIFTAEKLYADLTLILYNDTIYLYVDGELCTGNFSNCYTMPVSITNGHLKASGSYAAGTAFRFGLAESSCWGTVVTYSNVTLKTGEDATAYIRENYSGIITE